jgi:hypothetical protein
MFVTPTIRLARALGAGGMGSVWVADHLALHTEVVVKFMAADLAWSADAVARFSREAAMAAQVRSPHVVQMLDHGATKDGRPFIVMELLDGCDLAKHLRVRGGRIPLDEAAQIVAQVAKALARAHERGVVHRDIKPDNVFLCDHGTGELFVKILDFGVAKAKQAGVSPLAGGTESGAMVGTPYYMSPEQIFGSPVDLKTDLWSLGVVAYEAVTGARPFQASTVGALAIAIHSSPLPIPSALVPELPPAFDRWFARACARDPSERFGSAKELADALANVVRTEAPPPAVTPQPASSEGIVDFVLAATTAMPPSDASAIDGGVGFTTGARGRARRHVARDRIVVTALVFGALIGGIAFWRSTQRAAALPATASPDVVTAPAEIANAPLAPSGPTAEPSASAADASAPVDMPRAPASSGPPSPTARATSAASAAGAIKPAPRITPSATPARDSGKSDDIF